MGYPNKLVQTEHGLVIYLPDSTLVESVYRQLLSFDPKTPFPFWSKIWPSAIAMATFLQNEPNYTSNKKVLEIGAGIGLPSFTIADETASIIISDYSPDAVELIQKNIDHLKIGNATAICLDWKAFPMDLFADTIVLSDINYDPTQFDALNRLIQHYLNQGSTIIIATPQRIIATPFVKLVEPYIKKICTQEIQIEKEWLVISICILYQ